MAEYMDWGLKGLGIAATIIVAIWGVSRVTTKTRQKASAKGGSTVIQAGRDIRNNDR